MTFDEQLRRVLDAALAELAQVARADVERAREQGIEEGHAKAIEHGRAQEALERLVDACRALDRAGSLSDALDTAASCAAREAARAAVLLVRDGRIRGWRFVGFNGSIDEKAFEQPLAGSGVIERALNNPGAAALGDGSVLGQVSSASSGPGHGFAFALTVAGEVVAILYADGFDIDGSAGAALRLEAIGRHASRVVEALTALKTARALVASADDRTPTAVVPDADEADASARRYAKLLVSEIKLYHEPDVLAGRRERDLVSRLGGEIARARGLYEQRVPQAVRMRTDYFRDELVKTLANGDASLLHLS